MNYNKNGQHELGKWWFDSKKIFFSDSNQGLFLQVKKGHQSPGFHVYVDISKRQNYCSDHSIPDDTDIFLNPSRTSTFTRNSPELSQDRVFTISEFRPSAPQILQIPDDLPPSYDEAMNAK